MVNSYAIRFEGALSQNLNGFASERLIIMKARIHSFAELATELSIVTQYSTGRFGVCGQVNIHGTLHEMGMQLGTGRSAKKLITRNAENA